MKKAITFIALASVAMSSEVYENEFFKLKDVVADVKNIKHDIKTHHIDSAIHHGVDTIRDITGKDSKFLHKVDEEVEKFKKFAAKHPELVEKVHDQLKKYRDHKVLKADIKKAADFIEKLHHHKKHTVEHDDDELFKFKDFIHHAEKDIKKATHFVHEHPQVVEDGFKIAKDIKHKDYKNLVHDGVQTLKDLGFEDDELAHFKDIFKHIKEDVKKAGHFVHEHPEVIQDGANIAKDIKHKDYKNLIHDGVETLRHLGFEDDELFIDEEILAEFDDEELFSLKKAFEKVKNGVSKGINFIQGHPAVIKDGVNIVKDIKNKDVKGLIKDGIQTYKDVKAHDDEEFSLKKIGEKVGHVVEKGAHLVKDGANLVKDYKTGNVVGLIKDGKQTIKDIKAHDDEEFSLKKIGEKVGHVVEKGAHLVQDGAKLVKDYKTGDVMGLIKDGKQTIKDIKHHDDEELFAAPVKIYRDLGFEDQTDNSLFSLKDLIRDGSHIAHDIKNKDYGSLIKDGVQTVKDIKNKEKKFLF